jgi:hypothetical protein
MLYNTNGFINFEAKSEISHIGQDFYWNVLHSFLYFMYQILDGVLRKQLFKKYF